MQIKLVATDARTYSANAQGHHVPLTQDVLWVEVKKNWRNQLFIIQEVATQQVVGLANLLWVNDNNLGGNFGYVPRGPVLFLPDDDPSLPDVMRQVLYQLQAFGEQVPLKLLRVEPNWRISPELLQLMREFAEQAPYPTYFRTAPEPSQGQLYYEMLTSVSGLSHDDWFNTVLHHKRRREVRISLNKGVVSQVTNDAACLDNFYDLLVQTSERHGISYRPKEYFERLLQAYPEAFFVNVFYEGLPLAMSLNVPCSDTVYYLYAASSDEHRNLRASTVMVSRIFEEAIARGYGKVTLGGVHDTEDGLYIFKSYFVKGEQGLVQYIGELDTTYYPSALD